MDTGSASGNGSGKRERWSLRLFGGFELEALPGGEPVTVPGKRERVLLAFLAISPKARVERRKLVTLLWGEDTDAATLDNLRTCVWNLRKALGDAEHRLISSQGKDIAVDPDAFEVDVLTFRRLARQVDAADLEAAASLYRGDFLEGLSIESEEFESWRREEATRCKDQALDVLARLIAQLSDTGETDRAIDAGLKMLRIEPLHEPAVRSLMRLYGESGRRGTAVELYQRLAEGLRRDFNAQPQTETRAAFAEISRGGDEPKAVAAMPAEVGQSHMTIARFEGPPPEQVGGRLSPQGGGGIKGTRPRKHKRTLGWLAAGGLASAAIALLLFQQLAPSSGTTTRQQTGAEVKAVSSLPAGTIAIAVLPFVNMSGDAGQDFFSDGMTEEITSALAMVPDLKVVARTSAFQFKGERNDVRAVGQALNATHLVEGSMRKDGNRVRISAQLIEAGNGTHLWTQNYDRQLSDIFTTQEEIARTIVGSLMAPLGLAPGETLVHGTQNLGTYQDYLQAKAWYRDRFSPRSGPFLQTLESVVARDPGFAPAWATLALAHDDQYKAEKAAQKAVELDPRHPGGYAAMAAIRWRRGEWAAAEDLVKQGLALDPNDPDVLGNYWNIVLKTGRPKEALAIVEKLRTLEPLVPAYATNAAMTMQVNGQTEAAIAAFEALADVRSRVADMYLARAYAAAGRYAEAADTLLRPPIGPPNPAARKRFEDAAAVLRTAPAKAADQKALPTFGGDLIFVYASVGALDRVMDDPERAAQIHQLQDPGKTLWAPNMAPVRKTERFKRWVRAAGLVDYWRERGWPEFCHPTTGDDFECD